MLIRKDEKSTDQDDLLVPVVRVPISDGQFLMVLGCGEEAWKFYVIHFPVLWFQQPREPGLKTSNLGPNTDKDNR